MGKVTDGETGETVAMALDGAVYRWTLPHATVAMHWRLSSVPLVPLQSANPEKTNLRG